jgi:hypothetical protein
MLIVFWILRPTVPLTNGFRLSILFQKQFVIQPSREPNGGGINYAIYERPAVAGTTAQIEEVTMTPDSTGGVTVQNLITNAVTTIFPIR